MDVMQEGAGKRKSRMVRKQAGRKNLKAGERSQAGVAIWGEEWSLGKLF